MAAAPALGRTPPPAGYRRELSNEFQTEIARGCEGIKPGWVRVNLQLLHLRSGFSYIVEAVELIADHGYRLIEDYHFEQDTGFVAPPSRSGRTLRCA